MFEIELWNDRFGIGYFVIAKAQIGFCYEDSMINGNIKVTQEENGVYSIPTSKRAYFIPLISANIMQIIKVTSDGRHLIRFIDENWQRAVDGEINDDSEDYEDYEDEFFDDFEDYE